MAQKANTLILGLGNEILTDDGIGIKIIHHLNKKIDNESIIYHTASCGGLEIVEMMDGYTTVIIIDAIKTKEGTPGEVYHLTQEHFKQSMHVSNFHDISFLTAIEFCKQAGMKIPDTIHIIAIEIIEDLVFSNSFSAEIENMYPEIIENVRRIIVNIIKSEKTATFLKDYVST